MEILRTFKKRRKSDNHMTFFVIKKCVLCDKEFESERNKKQECCSRSCATRKSATGRFAERNSRWKGGVIGDSNGYLLEYDPITRKHRRQHLKVYEETTGTKLKKTDVIHHINLKKGDNRFENLMKFESRKTHGLFHDKLLHNLIHYVKSVDPKMLENILKGDYKSGLLVDANAHHINKR